ncbi:MAG: SDR family NAD(P)-dependent oxidoreductase [Spirochaetaceae bacterium]|nr:MAG: SDR family NAD(P)-dependent oxidoreductase [Spirochaetaceae bacterium]
MAESLNDMVIWVVGATGGIGTQLVRAAAAGGARLVLSGGPLEQLRAIAGKDGHPVPLDLTDHDALAPVVEAAHAVFGRIDLLVLNAGISQRAAAAETEYRILKRIIDIDFLAQAEIARRTAAGMVQRGSGAILVVSSLAGLVATPLRSGYCAAKHAIHGYYNALRAELAGSGVSVTIGVPGFVRTDISRNAVTANGGAYGRMDPNQSGGSEPAAVAQRLLAAALAGRREIRMAMGVKGRLALALSACLPGVYAWIIARARVT